MPTFRGIRRKKRKFKGNQHTDKNVGQSDINQEDQQQQIQLFNVNNTVNLRAVDDDDIVDQPLENELVDVSLPMDVDNGETANDYGDYNINDTPDSLNKSASSQKLERHTLISPKSAPKPQSLTGKYKYEPQTVTGYRFIDLELLSSAFKILTCPECSLSNISFKEVIKQSSAHKFKLACHCGWEYDFWSSKKTKSKKKSRGFDINKRFLYSMRNCGQGYSGMEMFCYLMDMPKPSTPKKLYEVEGTVYGAGKF